MVVLPALLVVSTILFTFNYTSLFTGLSYTFLVTDTILTYSSFYSHSLLTVIILLHSQCHWYVQLWPPIIILFLLSLFLDFLPSFPTCHQDSGYVHALTGDGFEAMPRFRSDYGAHNQVLTNYKFSYLHFFVSSLFLSARRYLDSCHGSRWSHLGACPDHNESGQLIISWGRQLLVLYF